MTAERTPRVSAGRRENATTVGPAQRLTGPRREVLSALEACGPAGVEGIADCWRSRHPPGSTLGEGLPEMVSRLLFKLEALGWVEPVEDGFAITEPGLAALRDTRPPHDPTGRPPADN